MATRERSPKPSHTAANAVFTEPFVRRGCAGVRRPRRPLWWPNSSRVRLPRRPMMRSKGAAGVREPKVVVVSPVWVHPGWYHRQQSRGRQYLRRWEHSRRRVDARPSPSRWISRERLGPKATRSISLKDQPEAHGFVGAAKPGRHTGTGSTGIEVLMRPMWLKGKRHRKSHGGDSNTIPRIQLATYAFLRMT
jgi:hypothetical protein